MRTVSGNKRAGAGVVVAGSGECWEWERGEREGGGNKYVSLPSSKKLRLGTSMNFVPSAEFKTPEFEIPEAGTTCFPKYR